MEKAILIIGGGLAGCEAAWQAARRGVPVQLQEMKPACFSPAHKSPQLAELVCSNSLRSAALDSAVGLLKEEMRRLGSLIMTAASRSQVPAGKALAVDREEFAAWITRQIEDHPLIRVVRQELRAIPGPAPQWPAIIIATGPLTSAALTESLIAYTGREHLAFYDAIAPIVEADSLDYGIVYQASRYDSGPGDYLNCPMSEAEYRVFIAEVLAAEKVALRSFETPKYFEGCLPIEVMVERGEDTPRFGPMKPVGLPDPRTGRDPYAVVQLRKENLAGSLYNMVGFQTKLTYPEQKRVFRMIPGMAGAEFARLGSIHRNTFICAPELLLASLQLRSRPDLLLAGQLSGVEGYVESTAMGLLAGINAARLYQGQPLPAPPPAATALGSLIAHLTESDPKRFQPANVHFGLFPALAGKVPRKARGARHSERALQALDEWRNQQGLDL